MEIEIYPLPDWAERLNKDKELIPGTQLMTKDGMRIGNARIVAVEWQDQLGYVFTCRSDMGNQFRYTVRELHDQFTIGPYILKKEELTARKIVLKTCTHCPNRDHKGAFGNPSCVPVCRLANQELPYTVTPGSNGRLHASPTYEIPAWCPLEHN